MEAKTISGEQLAAPQGPLSAALATQEKELMVLAEQLGALRHRLKPILTQAQGDGSREPSSVDQPFAGNSDYCISIEQNTQGVRHMQRLVNDLSNALEV